MSWSLIACLAVSIAACIVVVFAIIGGLGWGGSTLAQVLAAAVACGIGVLVGQAVHRRFF